MLILSRKLGESIVVGNELQRELKVTVVAIQHDKVRLGFEVDEHISVQRIQSPRPTIEELLRDIA